MTAFAPEPVYGLPENARAMRIDLRPSEIDSFIETKGVLIGWERASVCPCIKEETQQADPACSLCHGSAWYYFAPRNYQAPVAAVDQLGDVARELLEKRSYVIVKGLIQSVTKETMPFGQPGRVDMGDCMISVRHPNKLGFRDRLTCLDTTIVFSETRVAERAPDATDFDMTGTIRTRYPVVAVNDIRSLDRVYSDEDFELRRGVIVFRDGRGPEVGERLSLNYLCHPTYVVMNHPHSLRASQVKPRGQTARTFELPVQAFSKYEFLVTGEDD